VFVNERWDSIENHYQLAKRFETHGEIKAPSNWKEAKGKKPDYVLINGQLLSANYLSQYYLLLWVKYLDAHPELVTHASTFEEFHDIFRGKSVNCQADVIRDYVKKGRDFILQQCQPLLAILAPR
jgi:hypothetical protein